MAIDLFARMSDTVGQARTVEQLTRPLLELLEIVTGLESTYLTRIDEGAGVQTVIFARNSHSVLIPEGLSVPWADTLCKRALEEGRPYTDDVAACWGDSDAARALGLKTYASAPLYVGEDALYGTLCAASRSSKPLTAEGQQALSLFSRLIAQQIEREQLLENLQKANAALEAESSTDALTGLPNRRFVLAELGQVFARAKRTGQHVLVAFIDLDGFKRINDDHGHEAGDAFLVEVGRRLSTGLRAGDTLGRLGGDEFIIVGLTAPGGEADEQVADATRRRLAPLVQGDYALPQCRFFYPGCSFGIIAVDPFEQTPEDALRAADQAMYADKKQRRTARSAA